MAAERTRANGAPRRPTIDDVAAAAGVSRGTVSRVLQGGRLVSPGAHARVTAAIKKTGYRINSHARSLATARSNSVAFLLTEPYDLLFEDPNFSILMRGAANALDESDNSLVLIMAASADEQRRALDFIGAGHVDGVLLVSTHSGGATFVSAILDLAVPTIACGFPLGVDKPMGFVAADDEQGARQMVRYLLDSGRRRIATIAGPQDTAGARARLAGYRAELGEALDPDLIVYGDYGHDSGAEAMAQLLARRSDLDAVFAANDRMAAGAIEALQARGLRVPDDLAVAGFDDSSAAVRSDPQITTMRQPFERISREMVRLLIEQVNGGSPAKVVLPTVLVQRESA